MVSAYTGNFAKTVVKLASFSLGTRTYRRYAALFQLPKVYMNDFSTPYADAVVAAPILKLCPE